MPHVLFPASQLSDSLFLSEWCAALPRIYCPQGPGCNDVDTVNRFTVYSLVSKYYSFLKINFIECEAIYSDKIKKDFIK